MYRLISKNLDRAVILKNSTNQIRRQNSQNSPRQAGFGKFLLILTPLAATGGVIAYAKYDNEFRKTLVANVPGADTVIKVVLQEEKPLENISKRVGNVTSSFTGLFGGSSEKKEDNFKPIKKPEKLETKLPVSQKTVSIQNDPTNMPSQEYVDNIPGSLSTSQQFPTPLMGKSVIKKEAKDVEATTTKEAAPIVISKTPEPIPTELNELEKSVEVAAALAVQEYNKAVKILNIYNEDIKKVVDQAVEKLDLNSWTSLKNKTSARDSAVELAENSARNAVEKIDKYELTLSKVATSVDHERLQTLRNKIKTWSDHIKGAKDALYQAKYGANLSEKYWKKVESARNYFIDEIEAIFPGLNLAEKKLNLAKEDLDLFIMHAYSHVLTYQKELQRLQLDGELRLKRAIESLRGDDQNQAVQAQVEFYLDRERRNIAIENQKRIFQIRAESEKELRQQLKRQSEAHVDHLHDALAQKEAELRRTFMRELDEKISSEKAAYKLQLATMLGKLKGMDAALKARAESEKCAHQAQSLWAACQALWASVRTGEPGIHWRQKLRPLKSEIKAVNKAAAEGDELVAVVLQNLPEEAQSRGVYPEDALRERFLNVENVARKLALVPEDGASLPIYLLSYLQSVFILRPDDPISQEELQDKKMDFSQLDTYDILNRARYFMDRGDLTQALKYMNLLQGAPRKIASDWLKEARLLLETQQAANTLMAHAGASGLLYL